jgi:membrane-associated phospholipid phosphatase
VSLFLLIAALFSIFFWDLPIAYYFHEHPLQILGKVLSLILAPPLQFLIWVGLLFLSFFSIKLQKFRFQILLIASSITISWAFATLLKIAFGRFRPSFLFSDCLFGFHFFTFGNFASLSFPSGHAAISGALFCSLALLYPRYRVVCWIASICLPMGRVILTKHFLSDVLVGVLAGLAVSQILCEILLKRKSSKS